VTEEAVFPEETVPLGEGRRVEYSEPDESWAQDYDGLLYIGRLTARFEFLHHSVVIRSLRTDELLAVAQLVAEWDSTIGGTRAYATAMVALATEFIDGQPLPSPLGESKDPMKWARERFMWAQRLYPYTVDAIYDHYLLMERRILEILEEMGKDSGQEAATPGLSGPSGSPTAGDS
jgi:hypothetical protein